jgi:hypothetical protein
MYEQKLETIRESLKTQLKLNRELTLSNQNNEKSLLEKDAELKYIKKEKDQLNEKYIE